MKNKKHRSNTAFYPKPTIQYITTGVNHGRYKTKSKAVKARLPMQK